VSDLSVDAVKARLARLAKLMAENDQLSGFLHRIEQRRQELGLSERKAAVVARLSPSQIRTMRRQMQEGKQRGVSIRTIGGLAQALQTTPEWLISGTGPKELTKEAVPEKQQSPEAIAGMRLAGAAGAGLWQEAASENTDAQFVQVPAHLRYPTEYQSAYEVRGTSTNRFAQPGDYLIVVDRAAVGLPVRPGDLVIVTRSRDGLREVTARRFLGSAPNCELRFESTDPRYAESSILMRDPDQAGLTLGGIVVAVYRPLV
jgi:phage repressor protein C with HTH and peptisase S24 domain